MGRVMSIIYIDKHRNIDVTTILAGHFSIPLDKARLFTNYNIKSRTSFQTAPQKGTNCTQ